MTEAQQRLLYEMAEMFQDICHNLGNERQSWRLWAMRDRIERLLGEAKAGADAGTGHGVDLGTDQTAKQS